MRYIFSPPNLTGGDLPTFLSMRNIENLKQFITEQGKIIPQKHTGLTTKQQRQVKKHIKQARILGLLPFVLGK